MKITVTSTDSDYYIGGGTFIKGVHVRLWTGKTDGGIDVQAIIQSVRVAPKDIAAFEAELLTTHPEAKTEVQPEALSSVAILVGALRELTETVIPFSNVAYNMAQGANGLGVKEEMARMRDALDPAISRARGILRTFA